MTKYLSLFLVPYLLVLIFVYINLKYLGDYAMVGLLLLLISLPIFTLASALYFKSKDFILYFFLPNFIMLLLASLALFLPGQMVGFAGIISIIPAVLVFTACSVIFALAIYYFDKRPYWLALPPFLVYVPFVYFFITALFH